MYTPSQNLHSAHDQGKSWPHLVELLLCALVTCSLYHALDYTYCNTHICTVTYNTLNAIHTWYNTTT